MNKFLINMKSKFDNFRTSKKGAEIIEIIFGVVIAGVICVVAYKGIKGIVDSTVAQANSAFGGSNESITAPQTGSVTVPNYAGV